MKRLLFTCMLLATVGCTTINSSERVEGWPEMKIITKRVPHKEFRDICLPYAAWYEEIASCTTFDFVKKECTMWFSADFPPPAYFERHEYEHCLGHDHILGTSMSRMLGR